MTNTKQQYFACLMFVSFFAALPCSAYPIWVKIINPRAHSLYVENEREGIKIAIPSRGEKELKITSRDNDWRVRYRTGVLGAANMYHLDEELNSFIEGRCKDCIADSWKVRTVKYCTLRLDEIPGIAQSSYTLTVVEIRDLGIQYGSEDCALTVHELAMKVVPIASTIKLIGAEELAQKTCLYYGRKGTESN